MATKPPNISKPGPPAPKTSPPGSKTRTKKDFTARAWVDNSGDKIVITGDSGMGKTTLATTAPAPVFVGIDDGGRKIKHPISGKDLQHIPNIEDYADIRDVLQQHSLFDDYQTAVIDTITMVETIMPEYIFDTIKGPKGSTMKNIEGYGYNKGYRHLYDTMTGFLQDCDALCRAGKNIILIAQSIPTRVSNPGGDDYLCDHIRLYNGKPSNVAQVNEWADHILRIRYIDTRIEEKKIQGETTRGIFAHPEPHFMAKSRTLKEPVISFNDPQDCSLWQFLFPEQYGEK